MKQYAMSFLLALGIAGSASATVIDFTGGSVNGAYANHYEELGFQVDVAGTSGGFFGDYYGAGNNVIHAHWLAGGLQNVTSITISQIGGAAFDMNYFILTSNTDTGGGPANGSEQAWIQAIGGANDGYAQLLPSEDWGFPATQVFLGSQFDDVTAVKFYVTNAVDCFGMDEFYINEAAPIPEPASLALMGLGFAGLGISRRKTKIQ